MISDAPVTGLPKGTSMAQGDWLQVMAELKRGVYICLKLKNPTHI